MKIKTILQGIIIPFILVLFWEFGGRWGLWQSNVLPPVSEVISFIFTSIADGSLWDHLQATFGRILTGFFLGLAVAVPLSSITGMSPLAFRLLDPTIQALRSIPSLAWVPLFILWLGIGEPPKIILIALGVFLPLYLNLVSGISGVDRKLIEVGRTYGLEGFSLVRRIILPAALPSFFTGIRAGLGLGWMFVVAAELLGASRGLGFLLDYGRNIARTDMVLASILLFAACGKLTDSLIALVEKRALLWQDTVNRRR